MLGFCLAYVADDAHMLRWQRIMRSLAGRYAQMCAGMREPPPLRIDMYIQKYTDQVN